jgi:hypothetical protein
MKHYYFKRQKCKQYILKWDAVGSILKQTRKTSINNKNTHQIHRYKISSYETKSPVKNLQISSCSIHVATLSHVCNYKVQFCAFKGDTQNLPLRIVGRREISPLAVPNSCFKNPSLICIYLSSYKYTNRRWIGGGYPDPDYMYMYLWSQNVI